MKIFFKAVLIASVLSIMFFNNLTLAEVDKLKIVYEMYEEYRKEFSDVKDIYPVEAMRLYREDKLVFVDVREEEELEISMLPGAITKGDFLRDPKGFGNRKIVAYCTIGLRSGIFAKEMAEKKIDIYNLKGSMLAWILEGGRVYHDNKETKRVHVYGNKWDLAPDDYDVVMFGFFRRLIFKT
jgi:sodium/bile acid cotransporter 7